MENRKIAAAAVIGLLALSLAGCSAPAAGRNASTGQEAIAAKTAFDLLASKEGVRADELLPRLDQSLSLVSRPEAGAMILAAEAVQQRDLPRMEEALAAEATQRKLDELYRTSFDFANLGSIGDAALRDLLGQLRTGGYKVETAEGMYFPVIDYGAYRRYRGFAPADIAAYIDLMATESDRMPAKDGALVVGWDEVVRRALAQEHFLKDYGDSPKRGAVKDLYGRSLAFIFYGANNTPLFDYESKAMNPKAREAYAAVGGDSPLAAGIRGYMDILAKHGYRLTAEVEDYRKRAVKDLQG